jgi:acyl CoA:acetate/3-ketoacid CoA transferase alpha subunit
VRRGPPDLGVCSHCVTELDLLLATGLVNRLDITYIGLEVYGISSCLRRAVESGQVKVVAGWSNAGITWRLKAAAMGVPFLPVRAMLGSDTLRHSAAKVVEDPFTDEKVALLPALILDVGLIHVHRADRHGNAQIEGISGFAFEIARASKRLILSAEEIIPTEEIRPYPDTTLIPYYLVEAVVHAPYGSHPGEMVYLYCRDEPEIKRWAEMSKTPEGSAADLHEWVYGVAAHEDYLAKFGEARLAQVRAGREVLG